MDKEKLIESINKLPCTIEPYNEWTPISDPKSLKKFQYHNLQRKILRLDDVIQLITDFK